MSLKLGTTDINGLYLGSTAINQAYLGSTEVFTTILLFNTITTSSYSRMIGSNKTTGEQFLHRLVWTTNPQETFSFSRGDTGGNLYQYAHTCSATSGANIVIYGPVFRKIYTQNGVPLMLSTWSEENNANGNNMIQTYIYAGKTPNTYNRYYYSYSNAQNNSYRISPIYHMTLDGEDYIILNSTVSGVGLIYLQYNKSTGNIDNITGSQPSYLGNYQSIFSSILTSTGTYPEYSIRENNAQLRTIWAIAGDNTLYLSGATIIRRNYTTDYVTTTATETTFFDESLGQSIVDFYYHNDGTTEHLSICLANGSFRYYTGSEGSWTYQGMLWIAYASGTTVKLIPRAFISELGDEYVYVNEINQVMATNYVDGVIFINTANQLRSYASTFDLGNNGLLNNLVSYYNCNTDGYFTDNYGVNNGTISGPTYTTSGKRGGAYSFDGVNDYVYLPYTIIQAVNQFSINFWFKYSAGTDFCFMGNTTTGTSGLTISYGNAWGASGYTGKIWAYEFGNSSSFVGDTYSLTTNWTMCTLTIGTSGMKLYINGTELASNTNTTNIKVSTYVFLLGAGNSTGTALYHFNGQIDELGFYVGELTQNNIDDLYNSGSGLLLEQFTL